MGMLIENSIIKFALFAVLSRALSAGADGLREESRPGGIQSFRMINEFDDERQNQQEEERNGAFTLTSDRRSSVAECGGVYKRLQSEIRSPGFPAGYGGNLHCEYTFKSPFVCSSQYHLQFVEFALEPSRNCSKDRFVIGAEEVLCGTVLGAKRYDAPGGVLRMKFVTDGWGTGRGFRILVTRQPCSDDNEAAESSTEYTVFSTIQVADSEEAGSPEDLTTTTEAAKAVAVSSRQDIPPEFNPGGNGGYLPPPPSNVPTYPTGPYPPATVPCPAPCYPPPWGCAPPPYPYFPHRSPCDPRYQSCPPGVYPPSYPSYPQLPSGPAPGCPWGACGPGQGSSGTPQYPQYPTALYPDYTPGSPAGTEGTNSLGGPPPGYEPVKSEDARPEYAEPTTERPESQVALVPGVGPLPRACCRNAFTQRRFYLSSANFPSSNTVEQDCVVQVRRFSPHTCRLVIGFKFFLLGNDQYAPGTCPGGFVEIDGRRICGCRTGQTYRTADFGPYATKAIRVQSRAGRYPTVQGFVLEVIQEDCPPGVPALKRSDTERRLVEQPTAADRRVSFEMGRVEGTLLPTQTTNSTSRTTTVTTTQQVYYYDLDEAQPVVRIPQESRLHPHYWPPAGASEKFVQPAPGSGPNRCLFTAADWLRLKLDWLWLFKPVCLA